MNLSGNTVLITGGTSGIGLAFAQEFIKRGNSVIICGRREARLEHIRQQYPGIITYLADVADGKGREDLAARMLQEHPQTNVLVNNAGVQLLADLTRPV